MRNREHVIGLFEGMLERSTLTFNPGWNQRGEETDSFTDVRELQRALKEQGVAFVQEADAHGEGPASCVLSDPDGNPILIDQHRRERSRPRAARTRACADHHGGARQRGLR